MGRTFIDWRGCLAHRSGKRCALPPAWAPLYSRRWAFMVQQSVGRSCHRCEARNGETFPGVGPMSKWLLILTGILAMAGDARAGWYHVENFEGRVGSDTIRLSLQRYDGFGSGITVEGSYYRDSDLTPVALYGKAAGGSLELCEITSEAELLKTIIQGSKTPVETAGCPLKLHVTPDRATGTWFDGAETRAVDFTKVATLDDTGDGALTGDVEIPFWAQMPTQVFIGLYSQTSSGICMTKLRVGNKATGKIEQEIAFPDEPCDAGMLMTPIYLNVEIGDDEAVLVNFRDGRMGFARSFKFDAGTNKFRQVD